MNRWKKMENLSYSQKLNDKNKFQLIDYSVDSTEDSGTVEKNSLSKKKFYEILSGYEKHHIYQLAIEKVRTTRKSLTFPFYADSRAKRFHMELVITPSNEHEIILEAKLIREEKLTDAIKRGRDDISLKEMISMCSWCKQIEYQDKWLEFETAVIKMELFSQENIPPVTHGICDDCALAVRSEFNKLN
jgi:hypothetical protein